MRTTLASTLAALGTVATVSTLGACGVTPSEPEGPPMPSARRSSGEMAEADVAAARACLTRYRYPALGVTFDCRTALVDGDPHHLVTTCPVPLTPRTSWHPPDRDEVELDAGGRVVHEHVTFQAPPGGSQPVEDTINLYDADGNLQEQTTTDGAGTVYAHSTVLERNADGQPVKIARTVQPIKVYTTYPETAQVTTTLGYDRLGRLHTAQGEFSTIGFTFYDRTITYDDRARRRSFLTIVDLSGVSPELGGAEPNPAYELLDADGHVLEYGNLHDGYFVDYRYDAQGRVVSEVHSGHTEALAINYLYDCR